MALVDVPEPLRVCPDGQRTVVVLTGRTRSYAACEDRTCRADAYAAVRITDGAAALVAEHNVEVDA